MRRTFQIEHVLRPESTFAILQARAERSIQPVPCQITEVVPTVAVEISDLHQAEFIGRIQQFDRRAELSAGFLMEHPGLRFPQDRKIGLPIVIQVAGGQHPGGRGDIGNSQLEFVDPFPLFGLKSHDQAVRIAKVGNVVASVAVEIGHGQRCHFLIHRKFLLIEPAGVGDRVHPRCSRADAGGSGVSRGLTLQQQVDPAVTVVDRCQIGQSVVVKVAGNQAVRALGEFGDFELAKSVEIGE